MAKTPGVTRTGTAKNLADHENGFSANGLSEFSRREAHAQKREYAARGRPARPSGIGLREFFARTTKQLMKLRCDLSLETNRDRKAGLQRDYDLKTALAARLENEIADERPVTPWNWSEILTINGENEAEWFEKGK